MPKWMNPGILLARILSLPFLLAVTLVFSAPAPVKMAPANEGVVDIVTSSIASPLGPEKDGEIAYYTVGRDGRLMMTGPFSTDTFALYTADFEGSALDNGVLPLSTMEDANGKPVEMKAAWQGLLRHAALLPHHVFNLRVLKTGGLTFAIVEYNVNWHSPYLLFFYNEGADRLVELFRLNSEDIIGIRVRDGDALKTMK